MFSHDLTILVAEAMKNPHDTATKADIVKALRDKADALEAQATNATPGATPAGEGS